MKNLYKNQFSQCSFELVANQATTRTRGNQIYSVKLGSDFWSAKYEVNYASRSDWAGIQAWLDSLTRDSETVYAFDPFFIWLDSYRNADLSAYPHFDSTTVLFDSTTVLFSASDGPWGDPYVSSATAASNSLTTSGWVAGAVLSVGDMVSFYDGSSWRLHRITVATTADGGGAATVEVTPKPAEYSGGATPLYVYRAGFEGRVSNVSRTTDAIQGGRVTFDVGQIMRV